MPKAGAVERPLPLQGLFPVAKPSGPPSMRIIDAMTPLLVESRLFDDPSKVHQPQPKNKRKKNWTHKGIKIGQGGTLDPLADGVLVIGVNRGTKHLNRFLECTKEYESIGLLGASTTTLDAEGPILSTAAWEHITREDIEGVLDRFRGEIDQVPPIFSALKMEGKPLYEYARESIPLPRAIPTRKCTVSIDLIDFKPASRQPGDGGHNYKWPEKTLSSEEKQVFQRLTEMVASAGTDSSDNKKPLIPDLKSEDVSEISSDGNRPPTFTVKMTVSSGTYVRSIVHEIGLALGCAAHVVKLTRTRQGEFILGDESDRVEEKKEEEVKVELDQSIEKKLMSTEDDALIDSATKKDISDSSTKDTTCIPWSIFEKAIEERNEIMKSEKEEKEAMRADGASKEEIDIIFGENAILEKRRKGPLKEWEKIVLNKFVDVPVPTSGGHGHTPYGA